MIRVPLCFLWSALIALWLAAHAPAADVFVAPAGNDAHPGTRQQPFATIQRGRDAVRALIARGLTENVTVWIAGGTYRITEPIVLGPQDSGSEHGRVMYAAVEGEQPVISGALAISGWKVAPDGGWTTTIPAVKQGRWKFRELFINGRRAQRARYPNDGFLRVEAAGADRRTNFRFHDGDVHAFRDLANVEVVFLHDWSITRVPVKAIDEATRTLSVVHQIGGPSPWAVIDWFEKHPRYCLENSAEFLDQPGEWFLDEQTGTLTYRPRPGETIETIAAHAPVAEQLLVVAGDMETKRPVRNVYFRGLSFEHAAWSPPGGVYWGRQACTYWSPDTHSDRGNYDEADPAAVQWTLAEGCGFESGRVAHVGRSGIWFGRGCRENRVVGCLVSDVGGNGISIGEGKARMIGGQPWWEAAPEQAACGNLVANNLVESCGQELFGAVGIWVGLARDTTITHNEIRDLPYTGVSVGWMWWNPRDRPEPRMTPCRNNLVINNHIHHVMQTLSDGGGIYCLGTQPDSSLRGNLIHDVPPNAGGAESNGMFLDQGTGGFIIEHNVIHSVARSPLRFHKGWKNVVRNNVLEVGQGVPPIRYNDTQAERIRVENNTIMAPGANVEGVVTEAVQRAGLEPHYRRALLGGQHD